MRNGPDEIGGVVELLDGLVGFDVSPTNDIEPIGAKWSGSCPALQEDPAESGMPASAVAEMQCAGRQLRHRCGIRQLAAHNAAPVK